MAEEATTYDFLIVGAGIAGSTLALELHKKGKRIAIIDDNKEHSSSRTAAGMMNPMVPRNVQKAWKCDQIYPSVFEYYENWEHLFGAKFIHRIPTLQVHKNPQHTKNWTKRSKENGFQQHLTPVDADGLSLNTYGLPLPFGGAECLLSGKLDVKEFLEAAYTYFPQIGIDRIQAKFPHESLHFDGVWHVLNISAEQIVFAEGIGLYENPYFNYLPLGATGGDILVLEIPDLPQDFILKRKEWLVPIGGNLWLGGSTYHNESLSTVPEAHHAAELIALFKEWIPQEIKLVSHRRAPRPTVATWRPFLGKHPQHDTLYIYNGLGSKGSSLVSYLSPRYANFLCEGIPLDPEVDIFRFEDSKNGL